MKKFIICASVLGALCVGLGIAQSDDVADALQQIRQDLADLGLRVSRLEHAGGAASTGSDSSDATPARTMILVSVSVSDHTQDNSEEIASLKRQHAALMNTVNQSADQADADMGQQAYVGGAAAGGVGWRGAAGGGVVTTNVGSIGRQVAGDIDMTQRYATQAAITQEKLDKLQEADSDPKQILLGHDPTGKTIFTLESKFDLSRSLNSISIGDTVTWTGTRLSADSGGERWAIDSIEKAQ